MSKLVRLDFYPYKNEVICDYGHRVETLLITDLKQQAFFIDDIQEICVYDNTFNFLARFYDYRAFVGANYNWWINSNTLPTSQNLNHQDSIFDLYKGVDSDLCSHEWVDVGFQFTKLVCKKCDKEKKESV